MPFLRFTRDKRGYETTSLVHTARSRQGRTKPQLLYWFRTPPGVKVGRPALDEDAIRWIEEHNPDVDFDWPKILQATPPPPPSDSPKGPRGRRVRPDRRAGGVSSPRPTRRPPPPAVQPPPPLPAEAIAQLTRPDAEELPPPAPSAVDTALRQEQITRLRARYAELQARITERGGDAAQVEALRARAEQLNPDAWVTAEEVEKGLAEFETRIRDLRAALGLRRRRRSRRGGRRRRDGQTPAGQTVAADPASNLSDAPMERGEPEEEEDGGSDEGEGDE